jgi:hypothetical protein
MQVRTKKAVLTFLFIAVAISLPLCLFPINLFEGEIVMSNGLQELKTQAPLSLSYFFGLGYDEADMVGIDRFYLLPKGYFTLILFLIGIPGIFAYRVYLKNDASK